MPKRTGNDALALLIVAAFTAGLYLMGFVPAVLTIFALYTIACFVTPAKTRNRNCR